MAKRNGEDCPIFCASSNSTPGWLEYQIHGFDAGTYSFRGEPARDNRGSQGEDPGDHRAPFGGTSTATPLVSRVAALMLSRNPGLTADRIRTILRQTCQKIGDEPYVAGRNDHYGYGRIDAAALRAVPAQ